MNLNHFLNAVNSTQNFNIHNHSQTQSSTQSTPLYPIAPEFDFKDQNFSDDQDFKQQQNGANSPNFASLMQLLTLFSSKKQDLSSFLSSSAAKSLGINENVVSLLSLMNNKKSKTQKMETKASLPKIDSLERVK